MLAMFNFGRRPAPAAAERVEPTMTPAVAEAAQVVDAAPKPLTEWTSAEWLSLFGNTPMASGAVVTPETAMRVSAVYACVRLIAGAIGSLPIHIFKRTKENGRERAPAHPLDWLLNTEPNKVMTPIVWLQYMVESILLKGDSFNLLDRSAGGSALNGIIPINPSCCQVDVVGGLLVYSIQGDDGHWFTVDQGDVLHIPGVGFDGRRGKSVIAWAARNAIGTAISAEEYAARFFSNGARPDVVLKYPNKLQPQQVEQLRDYWMRKHTGVANAHTPAVLTEGGDIETLSMTAEDAQLLQSRLFQVGDIARAFGVPPHMIGETSKATSWGSGIESMGLGFITYTLMPYMVKIQQEINRKLLGSGRFFSEFVPDALLKGDSAARGAYYRQAIGGSNGPGWMEANEIRQRENLPAHSDGKGLYKPPAGAPAPTQTEGNRDGTPSDPAEPETEE